MHRRVRIGCAGCGDLALRAVLPHLIQADAQEQVELVAVCDVNADRAQSAAQRFRIPRWYDNFDRFVQDPAVEAVLLLTPSNAHAQQALMALERGRHVYLQKPLALTVEEANHMLGAAAKTAGRLLVAPVQRLCPLLDPMREVLTREIGSVYWALTATHFPSTYEGNGFDRSWHLRAAGGPLRDRTVYSLTTLTTLFGPAQRVAALSSLRRPAQFLDGKKVSTEIDDNTVLLLGFPGGVQAVATGNYCREGRQVPAGFVGIYGSQGTLETTEVDPDTWYPTRVEVCSGSSRHQPEVRTLACSRDQVPLIGTAHAGIPEAHVYADILHLVAAVRDGTPLLPTTDQARHVVEIIEKAYLADRTGQVQYLRTSFAK